VSDYHLVTTTTQTIPRPLRIINVFFRRESRGKILQRFIKLGELLLPQSLGPANILSALAVLAAVSQQQPPWVILFYGALWILFQSVINVVQTWLQFYAHDPEISQCMRCVKVLFGRVLQEGNKALNGNYTRRVVAAYFVASSSGRPGETYVGKVIRCKTASINQQVLDQIDHSLRHSAGTFPSSFYNNSSPEDAQVHI
jgi:hypothetical protein